MPDSLRLVVPLLVEGGLGVSFLRLAEKAYSSLVSSL